MPSKSVWKGHLASLMGLQRDISRTKFSAYLLLLFISVLLIVDLILELTRQSGLNIGPFKTQTGEKRWFLERAKREVGETTTLTAVILLTVVHLPGPD